MPTLQHLQHQAITDRTTHFTFRAPFRHVAGQYLALSATINGTVVRRYYSIASPPRPEGTIDLCIQHEGEFARHLLDLRGGDPLQCSEPAGSMGLRNAHRQAVYFAAGTGIAPMRAILLEQLDANPRADATLVEGARCSSELLYRDEFEDLASRHPHFRYTPVVSGDDLEWPGCRGRVTDHLDDAIRGRSDIDVYFCGQPEMVSALREKLVAGGIPEDRQIFERY